ncbi:zinc finger protein 883-like [Macrobrachium nipponense]|uniref:zinc finger protein 883-like n=1 Tax=Macrobrachium nipponense TaxID=159736 RepID=UPI0030C88BF2
MAETKQSLKCEHCGILSTCRASMDIHLRSHFGIKPYSCSICGKSFSRKANCQRHESGHSGDKPYECGVCLARYTSKGTLTKHLKFHTGENLLDCEVCGRKFTQNSHLKAHLRTHTGEKPFQCSICRKKFSLEYDLKMHQTVHEGREMPCTICGKVFHHLGSFRGHMLRHSQTKVFKCSICGIEFNSNCSLKAHLRVHTGEKPFVCTVCNRGFSRQTGLKDHSLIHDRERALLESKSDDQECSENDSSHFCGICRKRYANKYSLNQHMKVHAEKPIRCPDCRRIFTSESYLKKHQENRACYMKKFRCSFCVRVFLKKMNIIMHVKSTHSAELKEVQSFPCDKEKLFMCSVCKKYFPNERSRMWHEVCAHKLVEQVKSDTSEKQTISAVNCNSKELIGRKSDEDSRDSGSESDKDPSDLYPENSIFIKEEDIDSNESLSAKLDRPEGKKSIENLKEDSVVIKSEKNEDCLFIKEECDYAS